MTHDLAALARALREMNAAQNSYMRACAELRTLIPAGHVVLHRRPTDPEGGPYWWHSASGDALLSRVDMGTDGTQAVVVTAPGPREEYLPRLERP